jgi:hypothetical protein
MALIRYKAAFQGEQTTRTPLNEQDDENQHKNFAQHCASVGFEEFIDDSQAHGSEKSSEQIADTAKHNDHKGVDNKSLSHIRADVGDLAQCHTRHTGDAGTQSECECIDPRRFNAHGIRHGAILRDRAHLQTEQCFAQ